MKTVLISIQPKYIELIGNGKKTIEIRKTAPNLETPFKCYIYCSKEKPFIQKIRFGDIAISNTQISKNLYNGKVIGEFICEEIEPLTEYELLYGLDEINDSIIAKYSCLDTDELLRYKGKNDLLYGWHISALKIYDKPKEVSEFYKKDFDEAYSDWEDLYCIGVSGCGSVVYPIEPKEEDFRLSRPPRNWCYVEEL